MGKTSRAVVIGSRLFKTIFSPSPFWDEHHQGFRNALKRLPSRPGVVKITPDNGWREGKQ
jgi:hypothetical protein